MDSLSVVITEIVICLVIAWVLGFLAAWLLFQSVKKEYDLEIEELEDNLAYSSACSKNQEREITQQTLKLQEYEKMLNGDNRPIKKTEKPKETLPQSIGNGSKKKRSSGQENEMLKLIEENLNSVNRKR